MYNEIEFTSRPTKKQLIAFVCHLPVHLLILPRLLLLFVDRGMLGELEANIINYAVGMAYMLILGRNYWWNEYNALCDNLLFCIKTVLGSYLLMMAGNYGVNELVLSINRLIDNSSVGVNALAVAAGVFMFLVPFLYDLYRKHTQRRCVRNTIFDILAVTCIVFSIIVIVVDLFADFANPAADNPNNSAIFDFAGQNTGAMAAMAVFMAPIVEEPLFRAGFFAPIRKHSRLAAYAVTILLFAVYHIYPYALDDPRQWVYILQYVPVTFLLCRAYERTNSVWTSVFMHMLVNGVSVLSIGML